MTTNKPGGVNQMKMKWCISFAITVLIAAGLWFNLTVAFWFYWASIGLVLLGLGFLTSEVKNPKHKETFRKLIKPLALLDFTVRQVVIGSALVHTGSWNTLFVLGVRVFLVLIFLNIVKEHVGGQHEIT